MPFVENNSYRPPWPFRSTHFNTIYSSQLRRIDGVDYQRTTISTPDDDFIDLDWIKQGSSRLLIAVHGLEGSSESTYLRGIARHFKRKGWDILAMNFRSCSGRINRQLRSYHMGASDDLSVVVQHAVEEGYPAIGLVGFSLGGNVVLKYLGEDPAKVPAAVRAGVGISVPCHIPSANIAIAHWQNSLYMLRFMRSLNPKMKTKARLFP